MISIKITCAKANTASTGTALSSGRRRGFRDRRRKTDEAAAAERSAGQENIVKVASTANGT